jgi:asparagine synthase (glutamine-hydrolysing)
MAARLHHRGPDGRGFADGPSFAFGHTRLAVIDVATGAQPQSTPDGRFTLIFNGEIYNYRELRADLEKRGVVFQTQSDTEVLLYLLAREGEGALKRLTGMFALAFIDKRENTLLLARDHFGIKPLYYVETPSGEIVFASEIKALFAHPEVPKKRSSRALSQYLAFQFCFDELTLFEGIRKLPPGCLLTCRAGDRPTVRRYWELNFRIDEDHTERYFFERLEHLVEDAVRLQLRSDVPLGAYLSGGIDSSLVSAFAREFTGAPLKVFHGRFDVGPAFDESSYAQAVAQSIGAEYHEVVAQPQDFVDHMPALIRAMDEPAAGPGLFPQFLVSRLAREHVTVVLGGQGGDEIFGGYARYLVAYLEQALKGAIYETQEEKQHLVTLASIVPNLAVLKEYVPMMRGFWSDGLFEDMDKRYFHLINRMPDVRNLLSPDLVAQWNPEELFAEFSHEFNYPDTLSYINKMTHFDLRAQLPALLQVEDRVSMSVSLESRVPLLDHKVVDFVTTMPPAMKFKGGRLKHLLKRLAASRLPSSVLQRKDKMGFPVPLTEWTAKGAVREFVLDTVLSDAARQRGIFDPKAVEMLVSNEAPFGRQLWAALCLELWHRECLG